MAKHPYQQLALLFYRVNRSLQYLMTLHLKAFDITPEQWNVLKQLQEKDGLTLKDLGYMADKDKTTITRIIDSLEQRRALARHVNPNDRRSFLIYLTQEGRELIHEVQPIPDKVNRMVTCSLSEEELFQLRKVLFVLQTQIVYETEHFNSEK
ncbi:MarR family transcriptional regulator [Paenibacillus sp. MWE-103]|uniref:MarR family transcriptional regulator n=1 Tax=Paenibacillus artemisiicola TaxID=1172618 RepID=A0ABS3WEH6_9BACL|nr:MarR family transcriptional regulator [Paenibacillus artemisiicola]MBO7746735.1 MarR family transcriptional regulator [Paenibacillus artemisiicola]